MLITAGPTYEAIDSVRYIANRSSGRMGIELAAAARDAGWDVTLLLGPATLSPPEGCRVLRFESTADLDRLLSENFESCDTLVMAAAVADYRPAAASAGKLPRGGKLVLELVATPDLVAACARRRRPGQRVIGFALESPELLASRAAEKLARKGLDAIVANPLESMGAGTIAPWILLPDGRRIEPAGPGGGAMSKSGFAAWLIGWLGGGRGPG